MAVRRSRLIKAFARFMRARRGATAVEFAFVALPFLILLFGIIELGGVFMASTTLEMATDRAARQIRTGEFKAHGGSTKDDFKTLVCQGMGWLQGSCGSNLFIDVRTFNNFQNLAGTNDIGGAAFDPQTTCWATGEPSDVVLVRTFYRWELFTPMLDRALENVPGTNTRLISTVSTFRNEPYSDTPAAGAQC